MAEPKRCALGTCTNPVGNGTHTVVWLPDGNSVTVAICDEDWRAIREVRLRREAREREEVYRPLVHGPRLGPLV